MFEATGHDLLGSLRETGVRARNAHAIGLFGSFGLSGSSGLSGLSGVFSYPVLPTRQTKETDGPLHETDQNNKIDYLVPHFMHFTRHVLRRWRIFLASC